MNDNIWKNHYMIAEKAGLREKFDRAQIGWPGPERELILEEVLRWPMAGTPTRRDPPGQDWPFQPSGEDGVRPTARPVRIEIVIDPSQARLLIELLRQIFNRSPEASFPSWVGQGRALPTRRAFDLTLREEDVLEQMIAGKSNRQIALELEIAASTVKSHVSNILSKMEVQSRTEAVAIALQHQLSDEGT